MDGSNASAKTTPERQAGPIKRCMVWLVAALAIGCLATITFGGATGHWPLDPINVYHRGWPWRFASHDCSSDDSWVKKRITGRSEMYYGFGWALAGDVLVSLVGTTVIGYAASRALRSPGIQVSLFRAALLLTLFCAALGYVAHHRRVYLNEQRAMTLLRNDGVPGLRSYRCPRWLLQLCGDPRFFEGTFDHCTRLDFNEPTALDQSAKFAAAMPYLEVIEILDTYQWHDHEIVELLGAREAWPIDTLIIVDQPHVGNDALLELKRCPQLKFLNIHGTAIGDDGLIEIADACPELVSITVGRRVSDRGIEELVKCRKLVIIDVSESQVTDAGIALLADLPHLEMIYACRTQLTVACVKDLRKMPSLWCVSLKNCPRISITDRTEFEELKLERLDWE
jgi:hypothetical protein